VIDKQLLESCRALRELLSKTNTSTLRLVSPQLAQALPHIRTVLVCLEDLHDRVVMLELANRTGSRL
jgi:hypothetical protein